MKLELKHLAPYPPTLKLIWQDVQCSFEGVDYTSGKVILERVDVSLKNVKPILRPLSDLTEDNADFLSSDTYLNLCEEGSGDGLNYFYLKYNETTELFKRHYDVFGLIEKGLAIDINTLNN